MPIDPAAAAPGIARIQLPEDKIGREDRSAIICCHEPSYQKYLVGELRKLGFKVHLATSHQQAQQRLSTRAYDVTVLLENLEGCQLDSNPLLQYLCALPTDERRQTFVVLLCQSFATSDAMNAYAQSVDLLINYQDIAQFAVVAGPAFEEHEEGTRFFKTALRK